MFDIQSVHESIHSLLDELGADPAAPIAESVLVRDGFFVGRRFQRDGIRVVWFFEADELKSWGADGVLLKVVALVSDRPLAA